MIFLVRLGSPVGRVMVKIYVFWLLIDKCSCDFKSLFCPQIGFHVSPSPCLHKYIVLVKIAYHDSSIASFFPQITLVFENYAIFP